MATKKIRVWVSTWIANSKHEGTFEVDEESWNSMSDIEKEAAAFSEALERIEWGWSE